MDEPFHNIQIDIDSIPTQENILFEPLQKSYLTVSIIVRALFWIFIIVAVVVGLVMAPQLEITEIHGLKNYILILLFAFMFISLLLCYLGFFKKGYALREKDIIYRSGLFWKSMVTIPFSRIQHSEVKEGPIERLFNLASLHIFTAGGSSSDIEVPGLSPHRANELKQYILQRLIVEEEE